MAPRWYCVSKTVQFFGYCLRGYPSIFTLGPVNSRSAWAATHGNLISVLSIDFRHPDAIAAVAFIAAELLRLLWFWQDQYIVQIEVSIRHAS